MGVIFCVRHGQASIFSDNYDQLSDRGILQAGEVGKFFKKEGISFDKVFFGPLQRQQHTKDLILKHATHDTKHVTLLPELTEHQGYTTMKKILPLIIEEDQVLKQLLNQPWDNPKDQIRHHMRVYEHFSHQWIAGVYDSQLDEELQSWPDFIMACHKAMDTLTTEMDKGSNILVVTSAGPVATLTGIPLGLSDKQILKQSWIVYNCSISEILLTKKRKTLSVFNQVRHLEDPSLRTLV